MDNTGHFELFKKYVLAHRNTCRQTIFLPLCLWFCKWTCYMERQAHPWARIRKFGGALRKVYHKKDPFQYAIWMKFNMSLRVRTHESAANKQHLTLGALFWGLYRRDPEKTSRKTEGEEKVRFFSILFMSTDQTLGELCNPVV